MKRIPELDGLRGIMAWVVVASHLVTQSGYAHSKIPIPVNLVVSGGLAVDVFIILSGLVIFRLMEGKQETYGAFVFRCFFRLFPAYLVCLILGAFLVPHALHIIQKLPWSNQKVFGPISNSWASSNEFFWQHMLAHLTMLHGMLPNELLPYSSGAILDVAWSISLEWQFYLVAPLLFSFMFLDWNRTIIVSLVAFLTHTIAPLFGGFYNDGTFATWHLHGALFLKFHYFFLGILSHHIIRRIEKSEIQLSAQVTILALVMIAVFVQDAAIVVWLFTLGSIIASPSGSLAEKPFRFLRLLLGHKTIQFLGQISYSTYLVHISIIYFFSFLLLASSENWSRLAFGFFLTFLTAPTVLAASWALYHCIELPFIRLSTNIVDSRFQCVTRPQ